MKKYCRLLFLLILVLLPVNGICMTYEQYMYGDLAYTFPKTDGGGQDNPPPENPPPVDPPPENPPPDNPDNPDGPADDEEEDGGSEADDSEEDNPDLSADDEDSPGDGDEEDSDLDEDNPDNSDEDDEYLREQIEKEKRRLESLIEDIEASFLDAVKEETFYINRKAFCDKRVETLYKLEEIATGAAYDQILKEISRLEPIQQKTNVDLQNAENKRKNAAKALENNLYDLAELYADSQISGDPVNVITGDFVYSKVDFSAQDYNEAFCINRFYSLGCSSGSFGNNWGCSLDSRIIRCHESVETDDLEYYYRLYEICSGVLSRIDSYEKFSGNRTKYKSKKEEYELLQQLYLEYVIYLQQELIQNRQASNHNKYVLYGAYENQSLYEGSCSEIIVVDKSGNGIRCRKTGLNSWEPVDKSISNYFVVNGYKNNEFSFTYSEYPDFYIVEYLNGYKICYSEYGLMLWEQDRFGNETSYELENYKVSKVKTKTGEIIQIIRNADGLISRISASVSGTCDFVYSGKNLTSVSTNDGQIYSYEYDTNNDLVVIRASDNLETRIYYEYYSDYDKKMVSQVINAENNSEYFHYNYGARKVIHETVAKDVEIYEFDENWRTRNFKKAGGDAVEYEYNSLGLISSIKKRNSRMNFSYDDRNKLKRIDFNDGSSELYDYNSKGFITKIIDRDGSEKTYTYDSNGNIICEAESGCFVKNYAYFENGLVKSFDDGRIITRYEYNQFGNPILIEKKIYNDIFLQKLEYDSKNRLVRIQDDIKGVTKISYGDDYILEKTGETLERRLKYNSRKQLVELVETDLLLNKKNITDYDYTALGKVRKVYKNKELYQLIDYYSNGLIKQFSQFDLSGSINSMGDVPKTISGYEFLERNGTYEKYVYGDNYRIAKIESGDCRIKGNSENSIEFEKTDEVAISYENTGTGFKQFIKFNDLESFIYEYDAEGHLIGKRYPDGNSEKRVYSKAGRLKKIEGGNKTVLFEYSESNIAVSETDGNGNQSLYLYSLDGKLLESRPGSGEIIKYSYDAVGNLLSVDYGNKKRVYEYNLKNGYSGVQIINSKNQVVYKETLSDDKNKHKVIIKTGDKYKTELYYDAWNNLVRKISSEGIETFEYDGIGKCFTGQDKENEQSKEFLWDKNGHVARINNLLFSVEGFNTKEGNSFVTMKNQEGNEYIWWFDSEKNLVQERNYSGDVKRYTYNENGFLTSVVMVDGKKIQYTNEVIGSDIVRNVFYEDGQVESLRSDLLGNIGFIGNKDGQYEYKYDTGGKLIEQKDLFSDVAVIYGYDEYGRCIEKSCDYFDFVYSYSEENGLCSQIKERKSGFGIQIDYDGKGREKIISFSNGIKEMKDYDFAGRVISKETISPYGVISLGQYITYDSSGRISKINNQSREEKRFYYNSDGNVYRCEYSWNEDFVKKAKKEILECGNSEINEMGIQSNGSYWVEEYEYTPAGNVKSVKNAFGIINYRYDSSGRLIQKYAGNDSSGIKYEWSKNGCLLRSYSEKEKVEFVYENSSRPSKIICSNFETGEITISEYGYDVFGRRVLETVNGKETRRFFYDGFSTEMLMSLPVYSNYATAGIYQNESGNRENSEYNWQTGTIDNWRTVDNRDYETWDELRYVKAQDSLIDGRNIVHTENRPYVNVFVNGKNHGNIIYDGTFSEGNTYEVFGNDILGMAVNSVFDKYGNFAVNLLYDAWGRLICEESLQSSDTTKSSFSNSNKVLTGSEFLYDLGYRDYSPEMKCFISEDPQRFGENWYAYCAGDSVNYFDASGLFKTKMTEYEKIMYKAGVMKCAQFSLTEAKLNGESSGISNSFDCADVSFMVDNIASKTAGMKDYSDLAAEFENADTISAKKVAVQSVNFFTGDTESSVRKLDEVVISKEDGVKGLEMLTPGSVVVWKNPNNKELDPNKGWLGHTLTILSVEHNEAGVPIGAAYIEGHTGGGRTEIGYMTFDAHSINQTNYSTYDKDVGINSIFNVTAWIGDCVGAFEIERTEGLSDSCP